MSRDQGFDNPTEPNLVLTGFMATGKSAAGRMLAHDLGRTFLDSDEEIERQAGITVPEIFATRGEDYFRDTEKQFCRRLVGSGGMVVATGGGMPLDPENRKLLSASGVVVCLDCREAELLDRVADDNSRPLLQGEDPRQQARDLLQRRKPAYDSLPFHVDTTETDVAQVAAKVRGIAAAVPKDARFLNVAVPSHGGYPLVLGPGVLDLVGLLASGRGFASKIAVVSDSNVAPLYLERVLNSLKIAGFDPFPCVVAAGERYKTLATVESLVGRLLENGLDRGAAVVALGGGVIGDLTGFVAATFMRGVPFIQCPTTLLAMVDASVGGKTGVDLPQGKNLVGAFKQPAFVVADTDALTTLPVDQIRMGMAEVIKHAIIRDAELFALIESSAGRTALDVDLVERSVRVKIDVVEKDPLEQGLREVLNLGHTVGHAIEKCSGYAVSHGGAVAVGLVAAARISCRMGLCGTDVRARIESALVQVGLPVVHAINPRALVAATAADKKSRGGRVRFVLVRDIGHVEHGCEVSPAVLEDVLEELHVR